VGDANSPFLPARTRAATRGTDGSMEYHLPRSSSGLGSGSVRLGGKAYAFADDASPNGMESAFALRGRVIPATVIDDLCEQPSGTPRSCNVKPTHALSPHPLRARMSVRRAVGAVRQLLFGADENGRKNTFLRNLLAVSDPRHDTGACSLSTCTVRRAQLGSALCAAHVQCAQPATSAPPARHAGAARRRRCCRGAAAGCDVRGACSSVGALRRVRRGAQAHPQPTAVSWCLVCAQSSHGRD
jgi:hypothetical protein